MICPKEHERGVLNYEECDAHFVAEWMRCVGEVDLKIMYLIVMREGNDVWRNYLVTPDSGQ